MPPHLSPPIAESDASYSLDVTATAAAISQRAQAMNAASWPLYQKLALAKPLENVLISPLSLQAAASLLYPAAGGATATEMANVLGFDQDQATFNAKMKGLLCWFGH